MEELTLFVLAESEEFDLDVDNNLLEKNCLKKLNSFIFIFKQKNK